MTRTRAFARQFTVVALATVEGAQLAGTPGGAPAALAIPGLVFPAPELSRSADSLPRALSVENALSLRTFPRLAISLSPDGTCVAYTVLDPKRSRSLARPDTTQATYTPTRLVGSEVYLTETRTRRTMRLGDVKANSWGPVWSPDGSLLAFVSDANGTPEVWLWERTSGRSRPAARVPVRIATFASQLVRWAPDSRTILVPVATRSSLRSEAPHKVSHEQSTVTLYRTPPPRDQADSATYVQNEITRALKADLATIDITSSRVERVALGYRPDWYAFSPDGRSIAFANAKGQQGANNWRNGYDLILRTADGRLRTIARDILVSSAWAMMSWSPDGEFISYVESAQGVPNDIYVAAVATGVVTKITATPHTPFESFPWTGPLWDATGERLYMIHEGALWAADLGTRSTHEVVRIPGHRIVEVLGPTAAITAGTLPGARRALLATVCDSTKQSGIFVVDITTNVTRRLQEENASYGPDHDHRLRFDLSKDGKTIVFGRADPQHPRDLWVTDSLFQTARQVTDLNPWVHGQLLGDSRLISWLGADGERLYGALLLPTGYKSRERYPLISLVYAGFSPSDWVHDFGLWPWGELENMQLLATRGYAVLLPDLPQHVGTPMTDIAKALLPALNSVVDMGIADPNRLGIIGQSYGGYTVMSALVQTTRFKAAVVCWGIVDLVSDYGSMQPDGSAFSIGVLEDGQGLMRGTPWQFRERFVENSPVYYLDRVQTPVLIVHGADDPAVPVSQSDELFVDLRRLGIEVEYARYAGERHGLIRYTNQVDYLKRMIAWFDRHLSAPTDSAGVR